MKKNMKRVAMAVTMACATFFPRVPLRAAEAVPDAEGLRGSEMSQSEIKAETAKVVGELDRLIGEFDRNGLADVDDAKALKRIRTVLSSLTEQQMAKVVELLRKARASADTGGQHRNVADAFGEQKTIIVQMRQILLDFQRQQELENLSLRFRQLADREHVNMKGAVVLAKDVGGATVETYNDAQKASLQAQLSEQAALRDEVTDLLGKLATTLDGADAATLDRVKQATSQAGEVKVKETLQSAVVLLSSAKIMGAATAEQTARDQLRDLSRLVAPPRDAQAILRQAATEVEAAMTDQKQVIEGTKALEPVQPKPDALTELESRQADIVDDADGIRKDVEHVAPVASDFLKKSEDAMQITRGALNTRAVENAKTNQQLAFDRLDSAHKDILDQLAKLAEADKPKGDALDQAKALKERIHALKVKEEELTAATPGTHDAAGMSALAAKQTPMATDTRSLQPEAAPISVPAADALEAAAKEMDHVVAALTVKKDVDQAAMPEKGAADQLGKAESLLDQQIAKLEQDKKDLADLTKTKEQIAKLIKAEQKLELSTAKTEAKPDKSNEATKALSKEQKQIAKDAEQTKAELPEAAKDAAAPMDDAHQNMAEADKKLAPEAKPAMSQPTPEPAAARKDEAEAVKNLAKAGEAVDKKIAELQQALGKQPDPTDGMKDLAQKLDDAQKTTAEAQAALPQQPTPAEQLQQQQQQIADDLKQKPAEAQPAQQAAQKAADDLKKGDVPAAIADMKAAEKGMAEAHPPEAGEPHAPEAGAPHPPEAGAPHPPEAGAPHPPEAGAPHAPEAGAPHAPEAGAPHAPEAGAPHAPEAGAPHAPEAGAPTMPQLQAQQQALEQQAQTMAPQPPAAPDPAALAKLEDAFNKVSEAMAQSPSAIPEPVTESMQQAASALADATAQAQANQPAAAQQSAQQAQQAMAQAEAGLKMAEAGMPEAGMPEAGHEPGHEPGMEPGHEPGMEPGMEPSDEPGAHEGKSKGDRKNINAPDGKTTGARADIHGASTALMSLPPRDRQKILQSQKEKYPEEYGAMIEQYYKNLSAQDQK